MEWLDSSHNQDLGKNVVWLEWFYSGHNLSGLLLTSPSPAQFDRLVSITSLHAILYLPCCLVEHSTGHSMGFMAYSFGAQNCSAVGNKKHFAGF